MQPELHSEKLVLYTCTGVSMSSLSEGIDHIVLEFV